MFSHIKIKRIETMSTKILEQMKDEMRRRHYSIRTEYYY